MSNQIIEFTIDGKKCSAESGLDLWKAAMLNGVYIPYLCHMKGICAAGSCRVCTVKVNGRSMAACTTPLTADLNGANIQNNTEELNEMRKAIVELLFVEGNHYCPSCEKSGNCELQAMAYRFQMMVPQFSYRFPKREVDADSPKIYHDRNRCIKCKKCVRSVKDESGKSYFSMYGRGVNVEVHIDHELAEKMTEELALSAMETCPVGAIIKKERGFEVPIGKRKFDFEPIGSHIEKQN